MDNHLFTQALHCTTCAYPLPACVCPNPIMPKPAPKMLRVLASLNGKTLTIPAQAPEARQQPQDVRPLLDDILDATQKHMEGFTQVMPPSVQAKRETQKLLALEDPAQAHRDMIRTREDARAKDMANQKAAADAIGRATKAAPPVKRSLSQLAALL